MENSMFIFHGFAIHVQWNGNRGLDQWGIIWERKGGFAVDENNTHKFKL